MHVFHVGYVGIMGNIHYNEILDALLGWIGVDMSKDDGEREEASEPVREARRPNLRSRAKAAPKPSPIAKSSPPPPALDAPEGKKPAVRVLRVQQKNAS
jgi:hypothetical protein